MPVPMKATSTLSPALEPQTRFSSNSEQHVSAFGVRGVAEILLSVAALPLAILIMGAFIELFG